MRCGPDADRLARLGARRPRRRLRQDPPPGLRRGGRAGSARPARTSSCCIPRTVCPQGSAKNATDGFRYLVDEGCIGVAGAYSSDNAITVGPLANELQVPLISWCGTERLQGDYCFRLGNGDCGGDAALVVGWLKRQGHERVAVLSEISPNGEEYFRFFRQECRRRGVSIAAVETVSQSPDEPRRRTSTTCARSNADALVYMGYGMLAAKGLLREALDQLGWDPPRIMGTAFMFYLMGFDKFEGWVGIDQFDPSNPLVAGFHERFVARYGAGSADVAERDPGARVRHRAGARRGPVPRADPVGPGPQGRARGDPVHAEHDRRTAHAHRVLDPTSTGCSAVTGCSTAGCATARSSSRASSSPGSEPRGLMI